MVLRMNEPFANLFRLQRALDNARRNDWFGGRTSSRGAYPPVNVFADGDDFVLVAELPGVTKDAIDVQVKRDQIQITGTKTIAYDDEASVHRRERQAGQFNRTLSMPAEIDVDKVRATFEDGVLRLHLPRAEHEKTRSVSIN